MSNALWQFAASGAPGFSVGCGTLRKHHFTRVRSITSRAMFTIWRPCFTSSEPFSDLSLPLQELRGFPSAVEPYGSTTLPESGQSHHGRCSLFGDLASQAPNHFDNT